MKAVTLPVNVLVILSIGIVVLLGLISFFGGTQTGFRGLKALLQDHTGQLGGKTKTARCEEICEEIEQMKMSNSGFFTKEKHFCDLDCHKTISCDLVPSNYCSLRKKGEKGKIKIIKNIQ